MAAAPVVIELGGQKYVAASDMKVILLTRLATGSAKSLHGENDVDYQVPVGKVARILSVTVLVWPRVLMQAKFMMKQAQIQQQAQTVYVK